jgi:hypothetical protein
MWEISVVFVGAGIPAPFDGSHSAETALPINCRRMGVDFSNYEKASSWPKSLV